MRSSFLFPMLNLWKICEQKFGQRWIYEGCAICIRNFVESGRNWIVVRPNGLKKVEGRKIRFQRYNYTLIFNLPYRWDAK